MNESSLSQKEQNNDDDDTTLKWGINNDVNDDDDVNDFGVLFVTNLTILKRE